MNVLNKIEIKAKKAADLIEFTVEYTPGVTEDLDLRTPILEYLVMALRKSQLENRQRFN
jgi:hypothetical protein